MTVDQAALSLRIDGDGLAWLVFDRPESRVNLLTTGVLRRLDALLEEIEAGAARGRIKVLILHSGKPGHFIAGADVDEIAAITRAADAAAASREGQRIFRRLELLPVPTIAAIHGACLGGGLELALACTYRLASDAPATRLGLPEVRLGLIPGFGGTVRLPRLIGLTAALELIVTGRTVDGVRARRLGLVHECIPASIFLDRVRRFAWQRIDRGLAAAPPLPRRRFASRLLDDTAPGRRLVLFRARRAAMRETGGHYPAPLAAIETIADTLARPLDEAFRREANAVGELVASPVCKNLIHVFRLTQRAKEPPVAAGAAQVSRALVVGAGTMGGGIAQLLAYHGIGVRLLDIRPDAISSGLRRARALFDRAVERRRLTPREAARAMERITPAHELAPAEGADVVVEAVVEDPEVKRRVLAGVEERVRETCVIASNTSSLSITRMQEGLARPKRFCGMHFFNPVHRMPLVEIVRGRATSDATVATVFALALRLGKTPLVVNDGAGFLVNRILGPYLNEAGWLLADGASVEAIDGALTRFGMPMGPLRLLDEIGLDVARHVASELYAAFGERMAPAPPLLAIDPERRPGRKGDRGFYVYRAGREEAADGAVYADLGDAVPPERRELPESAIQERAVLAMVNEAARALQDGIVDDAAAVDLGMIAGTGFPPFRGGLLRYADALGLPVVLDRLEALAERHGPRFEPAPLLREYSAAGRGFYEA